MTSPVRWIVALSLFAALGCGPVDQAETGWADNEAALEGEGPTLSVATPEASRPTPTLTVVAPTPPSTEAETGPDPIPARTADESRSLSRSDCDRLTDGLRRQACLRRSAGRRP